MENIENEIKSNNLSSDIPLNSPVVVIDGLGKKYGRNKPYAIRNVSFTINKGELHGFIGANGAGKTTAIKSIIGAYGNYEGKVTIFGHANTTIEAKKKIGYIPENANFPTSISTKWYLIHMAHMSGLNLQQATEFTEATLTDLGLQPIAHRNPNKLSSGQKKKVLLAQALVGKPEVLIMDEPAANLDPKARKDFFDTLKIVQKQGKTIFLSSHILAELDEYVDAVTILDGGALVYSGRKDDLAKSSSQLEYVFKFKNDSDNSKFIEFVVKKNLKYKLSEDKEFSVELENDKNYKEAMKFIVEKDLRIDYVKSKSLTLNEIYDHYVVKGSVETGTGRKGVPNV